MALCLLIISVQLYLDSIVLNSFAGGVYDGPAFISLQPDYYYPHVV
jgi:hypothetical protein